MEVNVDFDIIIITIFVTIFTTGYIRGGGIELLRVLKVVIPFFVLYFYGDEITHLLFSNQKIVDFVYTVLPDIPYKNTIAALSSQIVLYIFVYLFLAIFLWRLGKYVLDERIEYIFGRYNSILGGIFSVIRMYIIVSIIIIPFYALNFTNYSDPLTSFVLKHPPNFSRLGLLIEKTKPTIDKFNEVSRSLKIMDIASLEKYTTLLIDVQDFVQTNEDDAYQVYEYLYEEGFIEESYNKSEFLYYYVQHVDEIRHFNINDEMINELNEKVMDSIKNYQQVFIWAYENNVLEMTSNDEIIASFIDNYPNIVADTDEELSLEILSKMKLNTQLYLVMKNWLMESYQIDVKYDFDLLEDENLSLVLDDFHLHKDKLQTAIYEMDAKDHEKEEIIKQINRFSEFQQEYITTYKPKMDLYDHLFDDVSFKYKLGFAIMKEKKFNQVVDSQMEDDSLMYLFVLDSLSFLDYFSESDNQIYYEAGQVYVALFFVDIDKNQHIDVMTYEELKNNLYRYTLNKDLFQKTKSDMNEIIKALIIERSGEAYLEYLIKNQLCEDDIVYKLLQSSEMNEILTNENTILLEQLNHKLQSEMSDTR